MRVIVAHLATTLCLSLCLWQATQALQQGQQSEIVECFGDIEFTLIDRLGNFNAAEAECSSRELALGAVENTDQNDFLLDLATRLLQPDQNIWIGMCLNFSYVRKTILTS